MDNQKITNRLNQLPAYYQDFVLGGLPQLISKTFSETHGFDEEQQIIFEDGFTLYLLFFFSEDDLIRFVIDNLFLEKKPAKLLVKALQLALPTEIYTFISETNDLLENPPTNTNRDFVTEIIETEAQLKSLDHTKTMFDDQRQNSLQNDKSYPSQQTDILYRTKNSTPPISPRWESGG